jgi:hypothetical protein
MNIMHDQIINLLTMAESMKTDPNIDKKSLNKTIARLEEARLWSKELQNGKVEGQRSIDDLVDDLCNCPEGALSANCPVHKLKLTRVN